MISLPGCVKGCPLEPGEDVIGSLGVGTQRIVTLDPDWSGFTFSGAIEVRTIPREWDPKNFDENKLLVIGTRIGRGDIFVSGPKGVRHYATNVSVFMRDDCGISPLWAKLPCGGDFDLGHVGDALHITGTYRSYEDLLTLLELHAEFPHVAIPPPPRKMVERAFGEANAALFRAGLQVNVRCSGPQLYVVPEKNQSARVLGKALELVAAHPHLGPLCALTSPVP